MKVVRMHEGAQIEELVELVDDFGRYDGEIGKLAAHRPPGKRHRAFSVFLYAPDGRLLLQRRAAGTYHSSGMWSNSCYGHPLPGEAPEMAARRRVPEELGLILDDLAQAGTITYRLTDPMSGLVEHEYNHVFVGHMLDSPLPDPAAVAEVAMMTEAELGQMQKRQPFSVWFTAVAHVARTAAPALLPGLVFGA
jgi:isopentenyl-diphosphate delta-isomerase